jgi:hypothetical protein
LISCPALSTPLLSSKCTPRTQFTDAEYIAKKEAHDCWHPENFALTNQFQSDDYGYGSFDIFASERYLGVFTILIAVGDSQSGVFAGAM